MKVDAVFEGGGVKGIGLVGAVSCLEQKGYQWQRLAGTSAGSIIAAMLAVGYTGKEMKTIIEGLDYTRFLSKTRLQAIPIIGKIAGILFQKGVYSGEAIETWMEEVLSKKGKTKFRDVYADGEFKLKIMTTDITKTDMLVLPDDLVKYDIDPMEFKISKAVRMSSSIPFYFRPVQLKSSIGRSFIVDGGVLSNFPVWIFDVEGNPRWPTFGFKIVEGDKSHTARGEVDIVSYTLDLITTMLDKDESRYIKHKNLVRTIQVPNTGVKATNFHITRDESRALFAKGYKAANKFMENWDYACYVRDYRRRKI